MNDQTFWIIVSIPLLLLAFALVAAICRTFLFMFLDYQEHKRRKIEWEDERRRTILRRENRRAEL